MLATVKSECTCDESVVEYLGHLGDKWLANFESESLQLWLKKITFVLCESVEQYHAQWSEEIEISILDKYTK